MGTTSAPGWSSRSGTFSLAGSRSSEGADGEEDVRRGRCDRDLDPLARGPLDQRGGGRPWRGPQDDPQVPGTGAGGGDTAGRVAAQRKGVGGAGGRVVPAPCRHAPAAGDLARDRPPP